MVKTFFCHSVSRTVCTAPSDTTQVHHATRKSFIWTDWSAGACSAKQSAWWPASVAGNSGYRWAAELHAGGRQS